jgi:O-antigen/teichoic acid export membrane protein
MAPFAAGAGFRRSALLTSGANGLIALLGFCTSTLSARLLGAQGRGELAAIQLWPTAITGIAVLGLPEALVFFAAREPGRAGYYLGSGLSCALLAIVPFSAVGYALMPLFLHAQGAGVVSDARCYMTVFPPIIATAGMLLISLRAQGYFPIWNVIRTAPAVGLLGVLALAWRLRITTAEFVAAGTVLAWLVIAIALLFFVGARIPGPYKPSLARSRRMLRYGLPSMLGGVPQLLNYRLDQIMMACLLPARMLGLYIVAVAWSAALGPVLTGIGAVLFPHIASEPSARRRCLMFAKAARLSLVLSLGSALGLLMVTPWGLSFVFGTAFDGAVAPACVLVIAAAIASFNTVLEEGIRGLGHPSAVTRAEFAGLVVTFIALLVLLPRLGIIGAAIASMLAYVVVCGSLLMESRWLAECELDDLVIPVRGEVASEWRRFKGALSELKNCVSFPT